MKVLLNLKINLNIINQFLKIDRKTLETIKFVDMQKYVESKIVKRLPGIDKK